MAWPSTSLVPEAPSLKADQIISRHSRLPLFYYFMGLSVVAGLIRFARTVAGRVGPVRVATPCTRRRKDSEGGKAGCRHPCTAPDPDIAQTGREDAPRPTHPRQGHRPVQGCITDQLGRGPGVAQVRLVSARRAPPAADGARSAYTPGYLHCSHYSSSLCSRLGPCSRPPATSASLFDYCTGSLQHVSSPTLSCFPRPRRRPTPSRAPSPPTASPPSGRNDVSTPIGDCFSPRRLHAALARIRGPWGGLWTQVGRARPQGHGGQGRRGVNAAIARGEIGPVRKWRTRQN